MTIDQSKAWKKTTLTSFRAVNQVDWFSGGGRSTSIKYTAKTGELISEAAWTTKTSMQRIKFKIQLFNKSNFKAI